MRRIVAAEIAAADGWFCNGAEDLDPSHVTGLVSNGVDDLDPSHVILLQYRALRPLESILQLQGQAGLKALSTQQLIPIPSNKPVSPDHITTWP